MFLEKYFPPSMVTKLRNEITNFRQRLDESLFKAWEHYKLSIDRCLNHNMFHVTQIDTFYNGLTLRHRDTIDAAAGGTFMKRHPEEFYDLIENMTAHHNDWETSAQRSESSSSINSSFDTEIAALKAKMAKINKNLMRVLQVNQQVKAVTLSYETCCGPHSFNDCPATIGNTQNVYTTGAYQGNTITNPKEDLKGIITRSGTTYQGPMIPTTCSSLPPVVDRETEATKDMVHHTNNRSIEDVQPLVVQTESPILNSEPVVAPIIEPVASLVSAPKPNQIPLIHYPSRFQDQKLHDKANDQRDNFFQIFKDLNFNISFADALILMPKFSPSIKSLLTNKDKLFELARTLQNEHCSTVLLKKLPEKLGDLGKFRIPCDFPEMAERLALADLDTSINLMPFSVWNKLLLPDLSPTYMTLELANRLISHPVGVAEDVFVKVGTFHFSTDFVVVDFDTDPRVPLILERSFLKTERALIDVFECELTLQYWQEVLGFSYVIASGNPTLYYDPIISTTSPTLTSFENSDFLLEEVDAFLALKDDPTSPEVDQSYVDTEGDILLLEAFLNDDPSLTPPNQGNYMPQVRKELKICEAKSDTSSINEPPEEDFELAVQHQRRVNPKIHDVIKNEGGFTVVENEENELIPTRLVTGWRVCIDYRKLNEATRKDHFPLPLVDQMLERLARNKYYCFLDGFSGYFQIPIDLKDQEKATFTCPYGTFAYRRMPFGLYNAPGTVQSSKMASAIILLATNQKFNFSKYIFDNMVKHLNGGVKFLMYPRFFQVFLDNQVEGKDFSRKVTPLFQSMMVQAPEDIEEAKSRRKQRKEIEVPSPSSEIPNEDGVPTISNDPLPSEKAKTAQAKEIASLKKRVKKLEQKRKLRTSGLKRLRKGSMNEEDMFGVNYLDGDKVVVDVSASEKVEKSAKVVEKEDSITDPVTTAGEVVTTSGKRIVMQEPFETPLPKPIISSQIPLKAKDKGKGKMVKPERPLKRKDQIMMDAEVAKNLKAQMQAELEEKERLARLNDKALEGSKKAKEGSSKRAERKLEQEDAKRQRIEEENESAKLKRCLEIIPEDDDDVTIEATPLSSKSPTIVDYNIYKEGKKSFFKIIRADDTIWKYQQGSVKVLNWKLFYSCGVYCVTTKNMVYYLLVERMYPFTRNFLHQMWNDVRLQVDYKVKMAYDLLRLIRKQINEGYAPERSV
nr:reverse transcriptase domain-containing protein [Tanacetum cinerariifolium]